MTDFESLSKRLAEIEKKYRRIKLFLVLGCLAAAAAGIMGQVPRNLDLPNRNNILESPESRASRPRAVTEDQVRAQQFVLVDRTGQDRASLVADSAGSVFLVLFDANGKTRADLSVGNYGPSLTFYDPSGQARMVLGSTMMVGSHVTENGRVETTPASSLVLLDRTGRLLWRAP